MVRDRYTPTKTHAPQPQQILSALQGQLIQSNNQDDTA